MIAAQSKTRSWEKFSGSRICREIVAVNREMHRACGVFQYDAVSALLVDPLGFDAGDSNLYRYVNNAPTNATDPSGLQEWNGIPVEKVQPPKGAGNPAGAGSAKTGDAGVGVAKPGNILITKFGYWTWNQISTSGTVADPDYESNMTITFTPNPKTVKSNDISFIQLWKLTFTANGKNANPHALGIGRMTANNWIVDRLKDRELGWYGYRNPPDGPGANITPGDSTKDPVVPAELRDTPNWDARSVTFEFQTFAIAKDGNGGKVLSGLSWGFTVDNKLKVTNTAPAIVTDYQDFKDAVKKWNEQAGGPKNARNADGQIPFGNFTYP
jgi:hypothetical protein